jgi:hypothetical protein
LLAVAAACTCTAMTVVQAASCPTCHSARGQPASQPPAALTSYQPPAALVPCSPPPRTVPLLPSPWCATPAATGWHCRSQAPLRLGPSQALLLCAPPALVPCMAQIMATTVAHVPQPPASRQHSSTHLVEAYAPHARARSNHKQLRLQNGVWHAALASKEQAHGITVRLPVALSPLPDPLCPLPCPCPASALLWLSAPRLISMACCHQAGGTAQRLRAAACLPACCHGLATAPALLLPPALPPSNALLHPSLTTPVRPVPVVLYVAHGQVEGLQILLMAISCRGSVDTDSRHQPRMCWLRPHHERTFLH